MGQNVAAGVAGIVIPVLRFGMDFGAARQERRSLRCRRAAISHDAGDRAMCAAANRHAADRHSIRSRPSRRAANTEVIFGRTRELGGVAWDTIYWDLA